MDQISYSNDIFESIPDFRKNILLIFLIKNDNDLLHEIGFSERDTNRLSLEFKDILIEKHDEYLDYVKNEEESVIEKILNGQTEKNFSNLFEDVRQERSLILLLSPTDPDILKQSKFTDDEVEFLKNLALEKLHRQRILKEHIAMDVLEKQFSDQPI